MARPAKFSHDQILDAARAAVVRHGRAATIAHVADEIEVPVGSIYHRFASREELFVTLWLRAVRRFQAGVLAAAADGDPGAALAACAVHVSRYCREHPDEALALTLYRHRALVRSGPPALADQVRPLNDDVLALMADLTRRRYGRVGPHLLDLVRTAAQQCPYGLVRPYVGGEVPAWLDGAVRAAAVAILALGDTPEAGSVP